MNSPLPFDELNTLKQTLPIHFEDGKIRSQQDKEDIIDELLDLFLLACANGVEQTNEDLGSDYHPGIKRVTDIIDREVAGKTWRQRVDEYYENGGTIDDIIRIAETEAHRDANEAAFDTAKNAGATEKVWHCMMLPTSRDQHIELNGVTAPLDGYFYTYTGARTMYPGEFGEPENDINCLCWLTYK